MYALENESEKLIRLLIRNFASFDYANHLMVSPVELAENSNWKIRELFEEFGAFGKEGNMSSIPCSMMNIRNNKYPNSWEGLRNCGNW